jgi:hypothetical protein
MQVLHGNLLGNDAVMVQVKKDPEEGWIWCPFEGVREACMATLK